MLYKRSSFIKLLREKYDCKLEPLDGNVLKIIHGPMTAYMYMSKGDAIDYEEVYTFYKKLWLPDIPGERDLERLE